MQRNRRAPWLALVSILSVALAACSAARPAAPESGAADSRAVAPVVAPAGPAAAPAGVAAQRAAPAPAQAPAQASPVDTGERLIIKTGNLTLLVNDVGATTTSTRELAAQLNGFVVTATQREEAGRPAATVTIRVPAERFDEAMDRLKAQAVRVSNEQVSSKDVTEEFVDTDARFRNLKASEQRYLDLLQQAKTVEDVLKVEQQLTNIRGQIEQLQARLQFLQRSAQTSAITIELRPYAVGQSQFGGWDPQPQLRGALVALVNTLQFLAGAAIWLVVFTPLWLPLALLVRAWRRRRAARRAARVGPPAPASPGAAA